MPQYPKHKYHWFRDPLIVKSAVEEATLGGGWADTPAAFNAYRGARPVRNEQHDPAKWVDEWSVRLSGLHRQRIKAQLLRADAAFSRSPDPPSADVDCMRLAFNEIARVLFEAGILTRPLLQNEIPLLVWDSAIAGGWWRFASETCQDVPRRRTRKASIFVRAAAKFPCRRFTRCSGNGSIRANSIRRQKVSR